MLAIAHHELRQIVRNRAVMISSLVMPMAVSAFVIRSRDMFDGDGGLGYIGAVLVFTIGSFSLYATTVTTLAGRRQTLFLKRLRSTAAADRAILSGLVLPVSAIALLQVAVILSVFAAVAGGPANAVLLALAILSSFAMLLALGLATAGVTNSPEHAQVTALPLSLGTIAVATWVGITGTESLAVLKLLLPGGAATELIVDAWNGGAPLGDSLLLLVPTFAWLGVAVVLATRMFRWEPRR